MKRLGRVMTGAIVLLIAFCLGFTWKDLRTGHAPSTDAFSRLVNGRIDQGNTPTDLFRDNYDQILAKYAENVDQVELRHSAMQGMFSSLGDPPTMFLPPQDAENFDIETKGNYAGIGARLGPDPLGVRVESVFKNGPADRAGLKPGDIVTRINGKEIGGKSTDEVVNHVRGKEGTILTMQVIRMGEPQPVTLNVERARVTVPTAEGLMIGDTGIGLIKVDQFSEITIKQFDEALEDLVKNQPRGIIIDLRGNPGGLLDTATAMLERFLEGKIVVSMKSKSGGVDTTSTGTGRSVGYLGPIVVLIDRYSASASEIFAGVLRDYKRATLVGEHSYGKASVQGVILLKDMSTAKVTVARYFLPGGENISRKEDEDGTYISGGLTPDFAVEIEKDKPFERGNPMRDAPLAKAIEVIDKKIGI